MPSEALVTHHAASRCSVCNETVLYEVRAPADAQLDTKSVMVTDIVCREHQTTEKLEQLAQGAGTLGVGGPCAVCGEKIAMLVALPEGHTATVHSKRMVHAECAAGQRRAG